MGSSGDAARTNRNTTSTKARGASTLSFERRKDYAAFSSEDAALLAGLRDTVESHADGLVERFYDHLARTEELAPLLVDPVRIDRMKGFQREYLLSLTSGRYDEPYAASRLRIGRVHEAVPLDPQWYLGAYGLYLEMLRPCVLQRYGDDPATALRAEAALAKLLLLDMQLVLDVYYERRQRKALERSRRLAAMGELAASVAHEVRNPLAGMKGALQVLRGELSVKPQNLEIVNELLAQIDRLESLVRDLLSYARPLEPTFIPFDLHELLDRVLRLHKEETDAAGITVRRIYGPGTGRIVADPQQLEQVFLNLIHNAMQAIDRGGSITLTTEAHEGELRIAFEDSGAGIVAEDLPRIFQPFFTTKHRGSGLGLPIVKRIVEAHDGAVEVESERGAGTRVSVRIPLAGSPGPVR